MTKTIKVVVAFAAAFIASAQLLAADGAKEPSSSLADARAKISQVIENPETMAEVMKTLSASNQVAFLADVNAAISAMPGSDAERTATFVAVNNAALSAAQKGNALALVAEVFATVSPSALPAVSESLASGLMNRAADSSVTYTDEQYIRISQLVMSKVNERVSTEDNSGVRSGFAAIMLILGSNSESKEIIDAVVAALPEGVRDDAKTDWLPSALGKGRDKSYDAILASVDGDVPKSSNGDDLADDGRSMLGIRARIFQNGDALISDIAGAGTDPKLMASGRDPLVDSLQNPLNYNLPNLGAGDAASDTATIISRVQGEIDRSRGSGWSEDISGYQHQRIR